MALLPSLRQPGGHQRPLLGARIPRSPRRTPRTPPRWPSSAPSATSPSTTSSSWSPAGTTSARSATPPRTACARCSCEGMQLQLGDHPREEGGPRRGVVQLRHRVLPGVPQPGDPEEALQLPRVAGHHLMCVVGASAGSGECGDWRECREYEGLSVSVE